MPFPLSPCLVGCRVGVGAKPRRVGEGKTLDATRFGPSDLHLEDFVWAGAGEIWVARGWIHES